MAKLFADVILAFHAVWMILLFFGGIAAIFGFLRQRPKVAIAWALAIAVTSLTTAYFGYCFLTMYEQRLRAAHDPAYERVRDGFVWRVLELIGIHASDFHIFLFVNGFYLAALAAAIVWNTAGKKRESISRETRVAFLALVLALACAIPWLTARGEGGGSFDCTGLIDLNALVTDGYLGTIPNDPGGPSVDGTGYEIMIDAENRVTVTAPNAETRTIEVIR